MKRLMALLILALLMALVPPAPVRAGLCANMGGSDGPVRVDCVLQDVIPRPGIPGGSTLLCGGVRYVYVHPSEGCQFSTVFRGGVGIGDLVRLRGFVAYGPGYWPDGTFVVERVRMAP